MERKMITLKYYYEYDSDTTPNHVKINECFTFFLNSLYYICGGSNGYYTVKLDDGTMIHINKKQYLDLLEVI